MGGFSGTDNVTRVCRADLHGVSLTRALEAIFLGEMVYANKCDGPGTVCVFRHEGDDGLVEAKVFFVAGETQLEIQGATIVEVKSEPDDAA